MTHGIGSEQARPLRQTAERGVVRAKLVPPRLPRGSVSRPGLLEALRAGGHRSLTLVSAPAGFGKTTLLAEWVQTDRPGRFAWVSLDAGDCEPGRFWTHVAAALSGVEPDVTEATVSAMRARPRRIGDLALPRLLDALSAGTDDVVLVLDDYHRAETPEISALLAEFMRYRPERVQLVVSTRSDPALGVARLRAGGDLVEVRADALRFDEAEVASFFDGIGLPELTPTEGHQLAERTGGWPAPLRLASLLMPERGRATFIEQFSGASRHVVDYLAQDVLDLLDPETRDFLLQVSILGRFTGSLCDAVTGTTGSGALLADLERANLFISVDSAGEWYHPHQLFTEALRVELTRTQPTLVPVLHARAAGWLEAAGDLEAATDHAIAARDVHLASRLVAGQVQPMSVERARREHPALARGALVAGGAAGPGARVRPGGGGEPGEPARRGGGLARRRAHGRPGRPGRGRAPAGVPGRLPGQRHGGQRRAGARWRRRSARSLAAPNPALARHRAGLSRAGAVPGGAG